jgi:hypothetical protein
MKKIIILFTLMFSCVFYGCNQNPKTILSSTDTVSINNKTQSNDSVCLNKICVDKDSYSVISDTTKLSLLLNSLLEQYIKINSYKKDIEKIRKDTTLISKTRDLYLFIGNRAKGFLNPNSKEPEFVVEAGKYLIYEAIFGTGDVEKSVNKLAVKSINLTITGNLNIYETNSTLNTEVNKFQNIARKYSLL